MTPFGTFLGFAAVLIIAATLAGLFDRLERRYVVRQAESLTRGAVKEEAK